MTDSNTILSDTQANSADSFFAFKAHANAPRVETKTVVLNLLRNKYPNHHVTEVEEKYASLFDYASAGNAKLTRDGKDEEFMAGKAWRAVGEGIEKKSHPGKVLDDDRFARYQYVWENKEYLLYWAQWQDMMKPQARMFYILSPRETSNITNGSCAETDALLLAAGKWTSQLHNEIFVFDDGRWTKSKELWKSVDGASWDDVILDPEMKKGLIEDVQGFFDNQGLYKQFAVPWKRGVILHGVPGNGKTVSIKALMSTLYGRHDAIPSLYVKGFETKCNTEQYAIRQIFQKARSMAPCLLIFEDLDSLVNDDIRSYFLNEVDGLESNDGILMIGSTNHLDKLDPAISKRPSRFDRKYHFKIPGEEERRLYAEYWRAKLLKNETVAFPNELASIIAQLTEGFSFAYLKELFVMSLLSLVRGFKGDDFEIVDAEEAASADSGDDKPETKVTKTKAVETCTCVAKCKDCNKPLPITPSPENAKKADEAAEVKAEAKVNKMVMPRVDVPAELEDNLLLKVMKHQIRVLHADMDNSKDVEGKGREKGKRSGGRMSAREENKETLRRLKREGKI